MAGAEQMHRERFAPKTGGFALLVLCVVLLGMTDANAGGSTISPKFDLNGDGTVDFDEFQKTLPHTFDRLDHNHDGKLTRAELFGKSKKKDGMAVWLSEARITAVDENHDGVWTRAQLLSTETVRSLFTDLDMDADHKLTSEELGASWLGSQYLLNPAP
jgi:Ca2+-binding EF-hand superfamily protein